MRVSAGTASTWPLVTGGLALSSCSGPRGLVTSRSRAWQSHGPSKAIAPLCPSLRGSGRRRTGVNRSGLSRPTAGQVAGALLLAPRDGVSRGVGRPVVVIEPRRRQNRPLQWWPSHALSVVRPLASEPSRAMRDRGCRAWASCLSPTFCSDSMNSTSTIRSFRAGTSSRGLTEPKYSRSSHLQLVLPRRDHSCAGSSLWGPVCAGAGGRRWPERAPSSMRRSGMRISTESRIRQMLFSSRRHRAGQLPPADASGTPVAVGSPFALFAAHHHFEPQ